ncbi:hypothetical protein V6N13_147627 [Hibiscus sabdariffa]|uniref:Uncharacterized protein n=1 Tax=Hibiscus sabdariffa TaxID=183260 RepID=A0ABR2TW30_9ROSI
MAQTHAHKQVHRTRLNTARPNWLKHGHHQVTQTLTLSRKARVPEHLDGSSDSTTTIRHGGAVTAMPTIWQRREHKNKTHNIINHIHHSQTAKLGGDRKHWLTHNNDGRGDGGARKSERVVARHLIDGEKQNDDGTAQFA